MKNVTSVEVLLAGTRVGELVSVPRRGTFFAYDEQWLATGFNLSPLNTVADRGYFKSEEILACHDANITAYVPKPMTSGAKADGRFNKDAFVYSSAKNEYTCRLARRLFGGFPA